MMRSFLQSRMTFGNLVLFFPLLLGLIWVVALIKVNPNVPWLDHLLYLERYTDAGEKITFDSLWKAHDAHRTPGYLLLFYLNIKYFEFTPLLEIIPAILAYTACVLYIINSLTKPFKTDRSMVFVFVILASLILMSGQNLAISPYSVIGTRYLNFSLFVLLTVMIYQFLEETSKRSYLALILVYFIALPVFGRGWGISVAVALLIMMTLWYIQSDRSRHKTKNLCLVIVPIIAYFSVYLPSIINSKTSSLAQGLDILAISDFYVRKFSSASLAVFDLRTAEIIIHRGLWPEKGLTPLLYSYFTLYILATAWILLRILLKKTKLTLAVWLALFLLLFPLIAALSVSVLRSWIASPYAYRHNFELSVGSVGLLFFLFLRIKDHPNWLPKTLLGLSCMFLVVSSGMSLVKSHNDLHIWQRFYKRLAFNYHRVIAGDETVKTEYICLGVRDCKTVLSYIKDNKLAPIEKPKPKKRD